MKTTFGRTAIAVAGIVLFLTTHSCAKQATMKEEPLGAEIVGPQTGLETVELSIKGIPLVAEVARTERQRQVGLMFRQTLEDGKGMLFVFEEDTRLNFWMANTLIPLSIAYIDSAGRIRDILDMRALSREGVPSSVSVRYALEAPLGWYGRAGIAVGDVVVIPESARRP